MSSNPTVSPLRLAVLASGQGTNAENIMAWCQENPRLAEVVAVICDNPESQVRERAARFKVPFHLIPYERMATLQISKDQHESKIRSLLRELAVDYICLAGYQRILSNKFIEEYHDTSLSASRILNIHPSLLPSFRGKDAYQQAFEYGVKMSGATLHFVDSGIDTGPIFLQGVFERRQGDRPEDFIRRGLEVEYGLYRQGLEFLAHKKVTCDKALSGRPFVQIQGM